MEFDNFVERYILVILHFINFNEFIESMNFLQFVYLHFSCNKVEYLFLLIHQTWYFDNRRPHINGLIYEEAIFLKTRSKAT